MFEKLRKPGRAKSLLNYIVFGAIILVFVFMIFPADNIGGITGGSGAAVVNSEVISIAQFREIHERLRNQNQERINSMPSDKRREFSASLRSQALNLLIDREVIVQQAQESGIVIPDDQVRETIVTIPWLQEKGRFRRDVYDNYLRLTRSSAGAFETRVRKDLIAQEVQGLFTKSLRPLSEEGRKDKLLRETKINLEFVQFNKDQLAQNLKVTDAEVEAAMGSEGGQAKIKEYYDKNIAEFTKDEEVQARHILIKVDNSKGEEADKKALEKINRIATEVTAENFGEKAAKYSEGPTKAKKGDLGYFGRGRMVKEFEEVAFKMKAGEVSKPVKTQFGYHLIKVEDHKGGGKSPLEEVQKTIAKKILQQDQSESKFQSLKEVAEKGEASAVNRELNALGLKWQETSEFDLSRAQPPRLGNAGKDLLEKVLPNAEAGKLLPELILSDGRYYLVKVKSIKVPEALAESKAKEDDSLNSMMQYFAGQRANEALNSWREEARKSAKIQTNNQLLAN